jgi:hypothetical protein
MLNLAQMRENDMLEIFLLDGGYVAFRAIVPVQRVFTHYNSDFMPDGIQRGGILLPPTLAKGENLKVQNLDSRREIDLGVVDDFRDNY